MLLITITVCNISFNYAQNNPMYVGTYTSNGSDGVYVYDFDEQKGIATLQKSIKTSNPSFLARKGDILYMVNENNEGALTSYNLAENRFLNTLPTDGAHPCHVSLSPNFPLAVVSNYSGGSLVLYSLNDDGSLKKTEDFIKFKNSGINKSRQESSHIHAAFFRNDGKDLFVNDLGGDIIYQMAIEKDQDDYTFKIVDEIKVKAGGGPRHVVFNDKGTMIYVVLELTGEIEVLELKNGKWLSKQIVPIYSPGFKGEHGAADIKRSTDGKYIYATNRGESNEILVYEVKKDGTLHNIQALSVEGQSPRNVQLSPQGNWVIVSNQQSGTLTYFKRNQKTGKLTSTGRKEQIPSAVCTIF